MAYRAYRSDRRFRRRRWLLILISLVAIIGVVAFLVSRQTEQRGAVEFFAAADESSATHSRASMELESALGSIGIVDRQDLTRRLDSVSAAAAEADAFLDIEVPSRLGSSYGAVATASRSWMVGTADLGTAITAVMDGDSVEKAQEQLQGALDLLRVGDVSYSLFLASLADVPQDTDIPEFSRVVYINPDAQDPLLYDAQSLVLRILSSYALSPHHDVAVTGMTNPEPVGERGGLPVVPFAGSLDIQAVVSNIGNEDEATVRVELEVFDLDSDLTVTEFQMVTDLVAGSSTTVTFSNIDVSPGGLYQTTVTATIPEDIDPDNNVWDITFIWRNES
jgi:hypothetical protein